jgi:hypothetical protein
MAYKQSIPIATRREHLFRLATAGGGVLTGQTFSGSEIQVRKAGGSYANAAGIGSCPELGTTGVYVLTLSTGELDTPGRLIIRANKAGALVWEYIDEVDPAIFGTAATGSLGASAFTSSLTNANDVWRDALIKFHTGGLAGQVKKVGAFANASGLITLASGLAFTAAPANGDVFEILND